MNATRQTPAVISDLDLDETQKDKVISMMAGNGYIDHEFRYLDARGEAHELAAIHFVGGPRGDVPNGKSFIDGIEKRRFEKTVYIYLEDKNGAWTGFRDASSATRSRWHFGILLIDDAGQGWFCGRDDATGEPVSADAPILRKISLETVHHVAERNGSLSECLPAEGEFWITYDDPGVVTQIHVWNEFAGPVYEGKTWEKQNETRKAEVEILMGIKERIKALDLESAPDW